MSDTETILTRSEYSAQLWQQMQNDLLDEMKQTLLSANSAIELYKTKWRRDSHARSVAEWECKMLHKRIRDLEAERAAPSKVQGVVIDDAMINRFWSATLDDWPDRSQKEIDRHALTAALTSATLVPLPASVDDMNNGALNAAVQAHHYTSTPSDYVASTREIDRMARAVWAYLTHVGVRPTQEGE